MSASLVGSEMCIRDSYKILRHKHFDMQFFGLKYERDCISTFLRNRLQLQIGGYYVVQL
ncbi:hypothetical protein JMUB7547_28240 [Staphylococcus aureus]